MTARNLGKTLCLASVLASALLHVATFLTVVPILSIFLPFLLLAGAAICIRLAQGWKLSGYLRHARTRRFAPTGKAATVGCFLLIYSLLLFVHFYRISGGANGVGIVEGQYVYLSKNAVIRTISEQEYRMFSTEWARVMSAWMAMMATFGLSSLDNPKEVPNRQDDSNLKVRPE